MKPASTTALRYLQGTGNRFALVDGFRGSWPSDPAQAARELCLAGPDGKPLDGLLLVGPGREGTDCVMQVWNADGSRAEMCGNGLRCVARLVVEHGHVAREDFVIDTDVGPRQARVLRKSNGGWAARVEVGPPRMVEERARLEQDERTYEAVLVDMGNPHCVLFVEDESRAPVQELGPKLERHAHFPQGTNVEFATPDGRQLRLRIWERGVGETASCGSGACAAAAAAIRQGRVQSPVEVQQPGGWVLVEWDGQSSAWLSGPVDEFV